MRRAMAEAEVGDDVFYEDPTVNRLQELVSEMLGKEKGLFVPSGTMSNQCAIKTHTQPGDELIAEEGCHILNFESGAPGLLSGVLIRTIPGDKGVITAEQIGEKIRPDAYHYPRTALIAIENTHNRAGGTIFPLDEIKRIGELAHGHNLPLHLDGARLWNASAATGITLKEYAGYFDSVSVCFSKGLGAPVGSMLLGNADFITRAHRYRKIFGGGMRQAGIIAAGALYGVEHNLERMVEDHQKAGILAEAVHKCAPFRIELEAVHTNIVIWRVDSDDLSAETVMDRLAEEGILVLDIGGNRMRAVCHLDVSFEEVDLAARVVERLFSLKNSPQRH